MGVAAVLVGAPGSGKSSVGRILADALGVSFRDTDDDIETAAGMGIADIFVVHGEARFRELERDAVLAALAQHDGVLAVGGGAVTSDEVRTALRGMPVIWLQVDAKAAVERVGLSGPRPVLMGNVRGQWTALLLEREPHYRGVARWIVDTTETAPEHLGEEIMKLLQDEQ